MQVTETIHALKIPFKLRVGQDQTVDRFVFAYLIFGDQICLIDSGVAGSEEKSEECENQKRRSESAKKKSEVHRKFRALTF